MWDKLFGPETPKQNYEDNPSTCKWCGKKLPFDKAANKYCSRDCSIDALNAAQWGNDKAPLKKTSRADSVKSYILMYILTALAATALVGGLLSRLF